MSDSYDDRLRRLARGLVADAPAGPTLEGSGEPPYVASHPPRPRAVHGRVLASAAAVAALLVAGGVARGQGDAPAAAVDAASALVAPANAPVFPLDALESGYLLARGSSDDPSQNTISAIDPDEVPTGVIDAEAALAVAPASPCGGPMCDAPFSVAALGRYQGYGGYDSVDDVDGPGAGDIRHDVIVWVLVRDAGDLELALDPGNHRSVVAVLIDARSGAMVASGILLPG